MKLQIYAHIKTLGMKHSSMLWALVACRDSTNKYLLNKIFMVMPSYIQVLCISLCLKTCWDSWKVNIRILQYCLTVTDTLTTACHLDMWLECHKHIIITTNTKYLHVCICEPSTCYRMDTLLSAESQELYLWPPQLVCHPLLISSLL